MPKPARRRLLGSGTGVTLAASSTTPPLGSPTPEVEVKLSWDVGPVAVKMKSAVTQSGLEVVEVVVTERLGQQRQAGPDVRDGDGRSVGTAAAGEWIVCVRKRQLVGQPGGGRDGLSNCPGRCAVEVQKLGTVDARGGPSDPEDRGRPVHDVDVAGGNRPAREAGGGLLPGVDREEVPRGDGRSLEAAVNNDLRPDRVWQAADRHGDRSKIRLAASCQFSWFTRGTTIVRRD